MIKYHDNMNGVQYGDDHCLTNNWNPFLDYGNEYVKVYFRIDTPSYHYENGFTTTEERNRWKEEASSLIKSFGILEDSGWKVEHSKDKQAYLYAHPQNISGVVLKNDVKKIAEAISNMKLSSMRWVDLYETVYVISDSEYEKYLDTKQEEIRRALFSKSATKRTSNYWRVWDVVVCVATEVKLSRLGLSDGANHSGGQTVDYVLKVVNKMIDEGLLKSLVSDGIKYIRSLNKTEQKKMNIKAQF